MIGFKLLVDVTKKHLIRIARESLEKNKADIIVANDLSQINPEQHLAYLVEKDTYQTASSKTEIAELLLEKNSRIYFLERKVMAHITLAVTGSIASYKAADLVSTLKKTRT